MKRPFLILASLFLLGVSRPALPFCGFYVARGDAKLFNRASQVVLVRDRDRTVLTMSNDFQGDPVEFAIVVPVPTSLARDQIHVGEKSVLDHLDAYSAPRLVEYFDPDPCRLFAAEAQGKDALSMARPASAARREKSLGVTVEARYTVGEYDILVLSAKESEGLEIWLRANGYRIPEGASRVLSGYLKQHMHFFVAKVNLKEQARLGFSYLRPIQVAYESPKFMLPIRLGMVNSSGPQELFVYALTRRGRVETTNYRTVRLPSDQDVPLYVKEEFADFYRALFAEQVRRERMQTVFLEYAWDMGWCDPCASDPLSREELRQLGVFWRDEPEDRVAGAAGVFITRLHLRYDAEHFPEDLVFQETSDRQNFQGRYALRHPYAGEIACGAAERYREEIARRQEREAENLAALTGWKIDQIRVKMRLPASGDGKNWWEKIWGGR
jgi:hypothetical protein